MGQSDEARQEPNPELYADWLNDQFEGERKRRENKKAKRARKTKGVNANTLTKQCKQYAKLSGGILWRVNTQGQYDAKLGRYRYSGADRGVSDLIGIKQGKAVFIEVKVGKDRMSDVQKAFRDDVLRNNGAHIIAREFEQFKSEWDAI